MNARLYAELVAKVDEWMDANCAKEDWPPMVIGDRTAECMASAARMVFDACEESQQYAEREGFVKSA